MSDQSSVSSGQDSTSLRADITSTTTPPTDLSHESKPGRSIPLTQPLKCNNTSDTTNNNVDMKTMANGSSMHASSGPARGFGPTSPLVSRSPFDSTSSPFERHTTPFQASSLDDLNTVLANLSLSALSPDANQGSHQNLAADSFLSDDGVVQRAASGSNMQSQSLKGTQLQQQQQQHQQRGSWSSFLPELTKTPDKRDGERKSSSFSAQPQKLSRLSTPLMDSTDGSISFGPAASPSPFGLPDDSSTFMKGNMFGPPLNDRVVRKLSYSPATVQQSEQNFRGGSSNISTPGSVASPAQADLGVQYGAPDFNTYGAGGFAPIPVSMSYGYQPQSQVPFNGLGSTNGMSFTTPSGSSGPNLVNLGAMPSGFRSDTRNSYSSNQINRGAGSGSGSSSTLSMSMAAGGSTPGASNKMMRNDSSQMRGALPMIPGPASGSMMGMNYREGPGRQQSTTGPGMHRKRGSGRKRGEDASRFVNATLADFTNEIYYLCKDQHGCRFLQRQLEIGGPEAATKIFNEIQLNVIELMIDPFGNYLIQKLLERVDEKQRTTLVCNASSQFVRIALDPHGTRALQKLVECVNTEEEFEIIVKSLSSYVVLLSRDLNGNHVIQKCLQKLPPNSCNFIFDAACEHCVKIAKHRHGCCVLQRCFDHGSPAQCERLSLKVGENCVELSTDPYGNYVVQYVLSMEETRLRSQHDEEAIANTPDTSKAINLIITALRDNMVRLSTHKFGSNVVEKSLRIPTLAPVLIGQLLKESAIPIILLHDAYGNYVLQTTLDVADDDSFRCLSEKLRPAMNEVRNTPHGRRILSKLISRGGASSALCGYATQGNPLQIGPVSASTSSHQQYTSTRSRIPPQQQQQQQQQQ